MKSIIVLFALCIAISSAQLCRDVFGSFQCNFMKNVQRISCSSNYMTTYCAKTCGRCGGPPPPPTQGPIPPTGGPPPPGGGCGKSLYQSGRVIAGTTASPGAWPWQVLLKSNGRPGCGGSLISKDWVVTAAHCINGGSFSVVLGEHDRNRREGYEQEIRVSRAITNPNWNRRTFNGDIALLKLSRPAQLSARVSPVCLPDSAARTGASCYITGWGKISPRGQMHHVLQQAPMQVIDRQTCHNKNFRNIRVSVTEQMICGGGSGRISGCQGDSGGPFVCNSGGRWTLHGAVSHGSQDCNSSKTYTVFGRVFYFRSWIRQVTGL